MGIPAKYGGFETLVEHLTKNQSANYDMTVYCSSKSYPKQLDVHNDAKLKYINLRANGVQSILYDIISIFKSLKEYDILLILGVSGCIILPVVKLINRVPRVEYLAWFLCLLSVAAQKVGRWKRKRKMLRLYLSMTGGCKSVMKSMRS